MNGIPSELLNDVLARFGLAGAHLERSFEASTMNDNLLAVAGDGRQYVLRRYRRNLDMPRLEFQVRFQQFLFDSHYPVPGPSSQRTARRS